MPIELAVLATTVVTSLLLPYIKSGAEKFAEEIGKKAGQATADHAGNVAKRVWERVKSVFNSDADKRRLADFEQNPEAKKALIEELLKEKLEQDRQLAQELQELTESTDPDGRTTTQILADTVGYVYAPGAKISGGIVAGVMIGGPPKEARRKQSSAKKKNE